MNNEITREETENNQQFDDVRNKNLLLQSQQRQQNKSSFSISTASSVTSITSSLPNNDINIKPLSSKMSTTERHRLEYLAPDRFKTDEYDKYGFIVENGQPRSPELTSKQLNQLRARENKWLKMLNKWDKSVKSDKSKIKRRCMKGIPYSLRGKVWTFLTGSYFATQIQQIQQSNSSKQPLSANLSANSTNSGQLPPSRNFDKYLEQRIPEETREQIERDLHRQFPEHEIFRLRSNAGISELRKVLHAYAAYNPSIGYCQGQGPIASCLLMHMTAEESFWTMAQILGEYGLAGYYKDGLVELKVDFVVFNNVLKKLHKSTYLYMAKCGVVPELFLTDWFMCAFARQLPWKCVLRLWDLMFLEGLIVIFKAAVLIVSIQLGENKRRKLQDDMMEIVNALKHNENYDKNITDPELFIENLQKIKITESMLQSEYKRVVQSQEIVREVQTHSVRLPKVKKYCVNQPIDARHLLLMKEHRKTRKEVKKSGAGKWNEISVNPFTEMSSSSNSNSTSIRK